MAPGNDRDLESCCKLLVLHMLTEKIGEHSSTPLARSCNREKTKDIHLDTSNNRICKCKKERQAATNTVCWNLEAAECPWRELACSSPGDWPPSPENHERCSGRVFLLARTCPSVICSASRGVAVCYAPALLRSHISNSQALESLCLATGALTAPRGAASHW